MKLRRKPNLNQPEKKQIRQSVTFLWPLGRVRDTVFYPALHEPESEYG